MHITSPASGTASTHHIVLEVSRNEAGLFPHVALEGYHFVLAFLVNIQACICNGNSVLGDQDDVVKVGCYLVTLVV